MLIPHDHLEATKQALRHLVDERTSAPWASYSDEDTSRDDQDYEDIDQIRTVYDVLCFLRDQGGRDLFIEYQSCLDPLDGFRVEGKEYPDETDEEAFREYLIRTYGLKLEDFL